MSIEEQAAIVGRIVLAALLGGVVGLQREYRGNPAGIRTLALVSLGAALFSQESPLFTEGDTARVAAQVVSGIGFLGAGVIVRDGGTVHGITTAATIWVAASVGMAVGTGLYLVALVTAIVTVVLLEMSPITKNLSERGARLRGHSESPVGIEPPAS